MRRYEVRVENNKKILGGIVCLSICTDLRINRHTDIRIYKWKCKPTINNNGLSEIVGCMTCLILTDLLLYLR